MIRFNIVLPRRSLAEGDDVAPDLASIPLNSLILRNIQRLHCNRAQGTNVILLFSSYEESVYGSIGERVFLRLLLAD